MSPSPRARCQEHEHDCRVLSSLAHDLPFVLITDTGVRRPFNNTTSVCHNFQGSPDGRTIYDELKHIAKWVIRRVFRLKY